MKQIIKKCVLIFLSISLYAPCLALAYGQTKQRKTKVRVVPKQLTSKSEKPIEFETDQSFEACLASSTTPKPDVGHELLRAKRPEPNYSCAISTSIIYQPELVYPPAARMVKASGAVSIDTVIDEEGKVIWAKVVEGHPLLRGVALRTLCQTRFKPIVDENGLGLKVNGWMTYNFVLD